jgi:hypothetical protein
MYRGRIFKCDCPLPNEDTVFIIDGVFVFIIDGMFAEGLVSKSGHGRFVNNSICSISGDRICDVYFVGTVGC